MKKLTLVFLVLALVLGLFAGCGGGPEASKPPATATPTKTPSSVQPSDTDEPKTWPTNEKGYELREDGLARDVSEAIAGNVWEGHNINEKALNEDIPYTLPLTDEPVKFTYWGIFPNAESGISSMDENPSWSRMQEITNVDIEFLSASSTDQQAKFNLMIASGDYADAISAAPNYYIGGIDKYIDNDILRDLTGHVDALPNLMLKRSVDEDCLRQTLTDKNRIAFIPTIRFLWQASYQSPMFRGDFLESVGVKPSDINTYDDWHSILTKAKESGFPTPYLPAANATYPGRDVWIMNGFDMGTFRSNQWYLKDGQMVYGPYTENYREYLKLYVQWYGEDLIDKDFYARVNADVEGILLRGETITTPISFPNIDRYDKQTVDGGWWTPVEVPRKTDDAVRSYYAMNSSNRIVNNFTTISTALDDKRLNVVLNFFDYRFTDEGRLLSNYGIEGVTYYFDANNKPLLYDYILNNPDGMSASAGRSLTIAYGVGIDDWLFEIPATMSNKALIECPAVWDKHVVDAQILPPMMDIDEAVVSEYATRYSDIETYVNEQTLLFILGQQELNDATWSTFLATIKSLGIEDCTRWQQDAYNRYFNRDITVGY